jgi:uncharacterized membrane-anchored protein YhcB (DUF1043 family)
MTWKKLIAGLVVVIVVGLIVAAVLASCGGDKSPKRQDAAVNAMMNSAP